MADKKITALTEMNSTGKAGEDFLHIIDYGGGSSPVNKRISLTNLFTKVNLDTHIYGVSKTFEIGSTDSASSAFKVTTTDTTTTTTPTTTTNYYYYYLLLLLTTTNTYYYYYN